MGYGLRRVPTALNQSINQSMTESSFKAAVLSRNVFRIESCQQQISFVALPKIEDWISLSSGYHDFILKDTLCKKQVPFRSSVFSWLSKEEFNLRSEHLEILESQVDEWIFRFPSRSGGGRGGVLIIWEWALAHGFLTGINRERRAAERHHLQEDTRHIRRLLDPHCFPGTGPRHLRQVLLPHPDRHQQLAAHRRPHHRHRWHHRRPRDPTRTSKRPSARPSWRWWRWLKRRTATCWNPPPATACARPSRTKSTASSTTPVTRPDPVRKSLSPTSTTSRPWSCPAPRAPRSTSRRSSPASDSRTWRANGFPSDSGIGRCRTSSRTTTGRRVGASWRTLTWPVWRRPSSSSTPWEAVRVWSTRRWRRPRPVTSSGAWSSPWRVSWSSTTAPCAMPIRYPLSLQSWRLIWMCKMKTWSGEVGTFLVRRATHQSINQSIDRTECYRSFIQSTNQSITYYWILSVLQLTMERTR